MDLKGREVAIIDLINLDIDKYTIKEDKYGALQFENYPTETFLLTDKDELRFRKGKVAWLHKDEVQILLLD